MQRRPLLGPHKAGTDLQFDQLISPQGLRRQHLLHPLCLQRCQLSCSRSPHLPPLRCAVRRPAWDAAQVSAEATQSRHPPDPLRPHQRGYLLHSSTSHMCKSCLSSKVR